jgi:hypothetical protein
MSHTTTMMMMTMICINAIDTNAQGTNVDERAAIETLVQNGTRPAGEFSKPLVQRLYKKGLIYLDVPIDDDDQISGTITLEEEAVAVAVAVVVQLRLISDTRNRCHAVPPLEGFVMNRVLGDYFENLLYKIFVSIDERTSVQQLAGLLQIDITMVKVGVLLLDSMYA